jgi:energy-converting hydrogenase Eha subunit E
VRNILTEWSPLPDRGAGLFALVFGAALALLGFYAVAAVVLL